MKASRHIVMSKAAEEKSGLFTFGFRKVSQEEYDEQNKRGFREIRDDRALVAQRVELAEKRRAREVREAARLQKEKSHGLKRMHEIALGTRHANGQRKKVRGTLSTVAVSYVFSTPAHY